MDPGGQSTSPGTGPGVSSLAALIYALSRPSRAKVTERESGESEHEPRSAKSRACKVLTTYGICQAWGGETGGTVEAGLGLEGDGWSFPSERQVTEPLDCPVAGPPILNSHLPWVLEGPA